MNVQASITQRDPRLLELLQELHSQTDAFDYDSEDHSVGVDVDRIRQHHTEAADIFTSDPDSGLLHTILAFEEHEAFDEVREPEIRYFRGGKETTVGDIKAGDFGELRTLTVDITELSKQYAQPTEVKFSCVSCGSNQTISQDVMTDDISEPHSCRNEDCRGSTFEATTTDHVDSQSAIVQDLPEASINPQEMEARIFDSDVNEYEAGDRVKITVTVRTYTDDKSSREYPRLEVVHAEKEEEKASVELSEDEAEQFEETSEEEEMLELLLDSYAPHLEGAEIEPAREGMLLTLFSGDLGLGDGIRDTIHTGHIGDPSTGKSDLLEEARKVAPHHAFASGLNASRAGLTAGLDRQSKLDSEDWVLKAGAMVRANDGVALIDELDKLGESAVKSLYDPLDRQQVKIDKIISKELTANPATSFTANPKGERFNTANPIGDQLTFSPALLSRFDLIFTVLDTLEADEHKADAMTGKFRAESEEETSVPYTSEEVRKLIYYARNNYQPRLTEEAAEYLKGKWTELRESMDSQAGVSIDTRQYESLMCIALTYARIRLSEEAELEDAERAWDITRQSFSAINRFGDSDTFDVTMMYSGESTSQAQRKDDILNKISELNSSENTYADEETISDALSGEYDEGEVKAELERMKESGQVFPLEGELHVSSQA